MKTYLLQRSYCNFNGNWEETNVAIFNGLPSVTQLDKVINTVGWHIKETDIQKLHDNLTVICKNGTDAYADEYVFTLVTGLLVLNGDDENVN